MEIELGCESEVNCSTCYASDIGNLVSSDFNITHHNIRSFSANYDGFETLFGDSFSKLSICVFTETWFNSETCVSIDGFSSYHAFRKNKRGGGVSIYVRDKYKSRKFHNISYIKPHIETCIVEISISRDFFWLLWVYIVHLIVILWTFLKL